jgi:hypothetical protein
MANQFMALEVFAKGIALDLGVSELSQAELAILSGAVKYYFGITIHEVGVSAVSRLRQRLPQDAHSREVLRGQTINGCLRKNDEFSRLLRLLINKVTAQSGDVRADNIGCVLYWVTQGIEANPQYKATVQVP